MDDYDFVCSRCGSVVEHTDGEFYCVDCEAIVEAEELEYE